LVAFLDIFSNKVSRYQKTKNDNFDKEHDSDMQNKVRNQSYNISLLFITYLKNEKKHDTI